MKDHNFETFLPKKTTTKNKNKKQTNKQTKNKTKKQPKKKKQTKKNEGVQSLSFANRIKAISS